MKIEAAKKLLKKTVEVNNVVIKEARKNGDINLIELTNDLDTQSTAIEIVLKEIENLQNIIENQKYLIQDRDQEIIELNQKCILERVAKEEVEELLENSISKDKLREIRDKLKIEYEKNIEKNPTYAFVLKCKLEVLEELLEDK